MSLCENCQANLKEGYYLCDTNDYRIVDNETDKNLIFIYLEHDLPENDPEIGEICKIKYCNENNCKYYEAIEE